MSNRREQFDAAANKVLLTTDERASLLVLHEDEYLVWLREGRGLEIRPRRLAEIIGALVLLSKSLPSEEAHDWLLSRKTSMAPRIPAAVLRLGKVEDVSATLRRRQFWGSLHPNIEDRSTYPHPMTDQQATRPVVLLGFLLHIGMTDHEIAKAARTDLETIELWSVGRRGTSVEAELNLGNLASVVERLASVIKTVAIASWLRTSVPALNGRTPVDVMEKGDYVGVERVIASMEGTIAT